MKFHPADLPPEPTRSAVISPAVASATPSVDAVAPNLSRPQLNPTTSVPVVVLIPPLTQDEPTQREVPTWVWGAVGLAVATVAALFLLDR